MDTINIITQLTHTHVHDIVQTTVMLRKIENCSAVKFVTANWVGHNDTKELANLYLS